MRDVEYKGAAEMPYNPSDYGLPVWRDEDHQPPQDEPTQDEPVVADDAAVETAKRKLCMWAEEQLGYREGDGNNNKYADTPGLSEMYGWNPQNQPWCDVFVDSGFISCFGVENACRMTYQPMGAGSALCKQSAQYYKEHDAFIPRWSTPEVGDQVFFYASGDINHTGIVIRVVGGSVVTIEGNSSDQVAERCYSVSDSKIAGYGRPRWELAAENTASDTEQVEPVIEKRFYTLRLPYLQRGDVGQAVKAAQAALIAAMCSCGPDGADGDFGGNTEAAVKQFQRQHGLPPDGIIGPSTGATLAGGEIVKETNTYGLGAQLAQKIRGGE